MIKGMKISDFLRDKAVTTNLVATDKPEAIRELVQMLVDAGDVKSADRDRLVDVLLAREALGSTGIGQGVGIPHGKSNAVKDLVGAFGISPNGVNFDALDGDSVYIFFLLVAPEDSAGPHLKALARISRLLKDRFFRESLREAKDIKTVLKIIHQQDQRHT